VLLFHHSYITSCSVLISPQLVNEPFDDSANLVTTLTRLGAELYDTTLTWGSYRMKYTVMLDGRLVAWIADSAVDEFVKLLRVLKAEGKEKVSRCTSFLSNFTLYLLLLLVLLCFIHVLAKQSLWY